jgi:hypothetical protein
VHVEATTRVREEDMADINLEPKRRSSAWGWIIAVIIVLIVLWAIFGRRSTSTRTSRADVPAAAHVQPPRVAVGSIGHFSSAALSQRAA